LRLELGDTSIGCLAVKRPNLRAETLLHFPHELPLFLARICLTEASTNPPQSHNHSTRAFDPGSTSRGHLMRNLPNFISAIWTAGMRLHFPQEELCLEETLRTLRFTSLPQSHIHVSLTGDPRYASVTGGLTRNLPNFIRSNLSPLIKLHLPHEVIRPDKIYLIAETNSLPQSHIQTSSLSERGITS
jgi:hypothetical protein